MDMNFTVDRVQNKKIYLGYSNVMTEVKENDHNRIL